VAGCACSVAGTVGSSSAWLGDVGRHSSCSVVDGACTAKHTTQIHGHNGRGAGNIYGRYCMHAVRCAHDQCIGVNMGNGVENLYWHLPQPAPFQVPSTPQSL